MRVKPSLLSSMLVAIGVGPLLGHAAQAPDAKPDSPQVKAYVEAARKAAGDEWAEAFAFWCDPNQTRANRADDPIIDPTSIFDNLYAIGRTTTLVFALKTSAGIVLIDS